ncbi:SF0329 family protein [Lysinibacillus piscis]|uniref:DUF4304 domain-containing protein n=1 Tax=Lysinibacillus piscis TaxID=2518931 RepID=A0ABQ5NJ62_9BACI|nr:nonribosomal peptide synthetase [Lysinibacillus sp. KH24]GLC88411.1 hypothetical protein LYSBPC_15380 [Lysinibacillus sp. KH24]
MRFSQLKKQFEQRLANSLKGKVKLYATVYRKAHDAPSKVWLMYEKEEILRADDLAFQVQFNRQYEQDTKDMPKIPYNEDWRVMFASPERVQRVEVYETIEQQKMAAGFYESWTVYDALLTYMNLSIEEAFMSTNPLIQAFSMIDYRLGKRRLIKVQAKHPLVQKFHRIRCQAEGLI